MEEKQYAVIAKGISKCYKMYSGPKQKLMDLISPKGAGKNFYALKDLSFKIEKGQVVGILGLNGSGKSTLSNILGGVSIPSKGDITLNGESSVIAIGLGLNNFLTGIENIEVKALMMGYKKSDIERITQEVIEFADIGDFINQPIRTYSSGMRSRLGFAISVHTNPDILVIDEALSVGDPTFTQKCLDKMNEFRDSGKTIFFVSHSLGQVKKFCNKAMWLEYGTLKEYGDIEEVLPKYEQYINMINKMSEQERKEYKIATLKNQEHSLLKEFKLIDSSLKRVELKGKCIKNAELIDKNGAIKILPYNLDILTLAFGFIPSLFRKRYDIASVILIVQILNFFIIPFPISIVTNFIITFISSIITGKDYINYLIEKKGYIPFHIWKNTVKKEFNHLEEAVELSTKKDSLNNEKLKIRLSIIASIIFIVLVISGAFYYKYRDRFSNLITSNKEIVSVNNMMVIMIDDRDENKKSINNIAILNSESSSGKLKGNIYPGKLQVKNGDSYNELRLVVEADDIESLKKVVKSEFGIDVKSYTIINMKDLVVYEDDKLKEFYTNSTYELLGLKGDELDKKIENILATSKNITEDSVRRFCEKYEHNVDKVIFKLAKYQEVNLIDIIDENILKSIKMDKLIDYKLYITDNRILNNNILVKEINTKYKEYMSSKANESINVTEYIEELETEVWMPSYEEVYTPSINTETNGYWEDETLVKPLEPPVIEQDPPVTEPEPPITEPNPPVTEPEPPIVDTDPPVIGPDPPIVDPNPPITDTDLPVTQPELSEY